MLKWILRAGAVLALVLASAYAVRVALAPEAPLPEASMTASSSPQADPEAPLAERNATGTPDAALPLDRPEAPVPKLPDPPAGTKDPAAATTTPLAPVWSGDESDIGLFPLGREFSEDFYPDATVVEAGMVQESLHPDWALTSGAYFYHQNGIGSTISGSLPMGDPWRELYRKDNPEDTDKGLHPQNIFRLVLLRRYRNLEQQAYFRVQKDNLSDSQYRNSSNGLLFMSRYQDQDNLYYAGLRVDGYATIKKKVKGAYYTLAYERFLPGEYDREKKANLLPKEIWLGMLVRVIEAPGGGAKVSLYWDKGRVNKWELAAEAVDDGKSFGGPALDEAGLAGIRTDFMDVEFADYRIKALD